MINLETEIKVKEEQTEDWKQKSRLRKNRTELKTEIKVKEEQNWKRKSEIRKGETKIWNKSGKERQRYGTIKLGDFRDRADCA